MKIFKFCLPVAIIAVLMTAQSVFGATGHAAGSIDGDGLAQAVPETGSTFALLFLSFLALVGATRLASFRRRS